MIPSYPRRRHDRILLKKEPFRLSAEMQLDRQPLERGRGRPEFVFRARIRYRDQRAPAQQKARRRQAGLAQSDDQHAFSLPSHRNFSVLNASKAHTNPAIQKRAITFDSGQPSCSK